MADVVPSSGSYVRPYRSPWGAFPIRNMPISTGVSTLAIRIGNVMVLDARTSTCRHRVYNSTTVAQLEIAGIAAQSISGSTATVDTQIPVWEANPMVEFIAATKGAALSGTHVGQEKTLAHDSTLNISYVDLADSTATNARVLVTELIDNVGDSGGRVAFRFNQTDRLSTNNSSVAYLGLYSR